MPESKINFIGGRMNKDVDERLVLDGQYRDAQNLAISNSDSGNSGSLENVLGTSALAVFGEEDRNLECIHYHKDVENNRVFMWLTNYTDSSPTTLDNFAPSASKHYIVCYDKKDDRSYTLVKGNFLNFSKTHRFMQSSLIEGLLFWTDNRNQPRKINVDTAISFSNAIDSDPYYDSEDTISVAKYYPWNAIRLYKIPESGETYYGRLNDYNHSLINGVTEIFDTAVLAGSTTYTYKSIPNASSGEITTTSGSGSGASVEVITDAAGEVRDIRVTNGGTGFQAGDTITFKDPLDDMDDMVVTLKEQDLWVEPTMRDTVSLDLPYTITATMNNTVSSTTHKITRASASEDPNKFEGCVFYVKGSDGSMKIDIDTNNTIVSCTPDTGNVYDIEFDSAISVDSGDVIHIGANPYYNIEDAQRISNIRDKFVRFAYRFKYDDDEYSLISPFTQSVFIPRQDGHFKGVSGEIDKDEIDTVKSTNVEFFENKVTEVELIIDLPDGIGSVSELISKLNVKEVEIIYKDSSSSSMKVVKAIKEDELSNNNSSTLNYTYKSEQPTKVLPDFELTRVSDKVPVRAKAQESIGNRIVYANYVRGFSAPEELDYSVDYDDKGWQWQLTDAYSRKEYPSHQLKQNRTYQVGLVLADKFGRKSDVITSENSTVFSKYKDEFFRVITDDDLDTSTGTFNTRADSYMGDALRIIFNEEFPENTSDPFYAGIYDEDTNPLGWYSYQVVVKQKEQSYYNAYIPTILNGYPKTTSSPDGRLAHLTLTGDNVNKIPRDFTLSNEADDVFRSSEQVYPRITNSVQTSSHDAELFSGGEFPYKISLIGTRDEMGLDKTEDGGVYTESPFYLIPDEEKLGSNPLIARMATRKAVGAEGGAASISDSVSFEDFSLNVVETRPKQSNIEIFWETSTSGLISGINTEALSPANSEGIPYQVSDYNFIANETSDTGDDATSVFNIQDFSGTLIDSSSPNVQAEVYSVRNKTGLGFVPATGRFTIVKSGTGFKLQMGSFGWYSYDSQSYLNENWDIVIRVSNLVNGQTVFRNILLPESALNNSFPTFDEDDDDFGQKPSVLNKYIDTSGRPSTVGTSITGWREVSDITITNGNLLAGGVLTGSSLDELDYTVDRVEWYNTGDSTWYDYWYKGLFRSLGTVNGQFQGFRNAEGWSRDPRRLIRIVFYQGGIYPYTAKMFYSPALQWGWHDKAPWSFNYGQGGQGLNTVLFQNIEPEYRAETAAVFRNHLFVEHPLTTGVSQADETQADILMWNTRADFNDEVLINALKANNNTTPTPNGIIEYSNGGAYGRNLINDVVYTSIFRNLDSENPTDNSDLQIRVTFTLFDANRNGTSRQFQCLFQIPKNTNYADFDNT